MAFHHRWRQTPVYERKKKEKKKEVIRFTSKNVELVQIADGNVVLLIREQHNRRMMDILKGGRERRVK